MIIIDLFDKNPLENAVSVLALAPEKLIFVGDQSQMKTDAAAFKRFIDFHDINVSLEYCYVNRNSLTDILNGLEKIISEHGEEACHIDLTGGDELVLLAVGMLYQVHPKLNLHRFNLSTGRFYDCDLNGDTLLESSPVLSVEESIILNGGSITGCEGSGIDFSPDCPEDLEFYRDISALWDICRANCTLWNREMDYLSELRSMSTLPRDDLSVVVSLTDAAERLYSERKHIPKQLLSRLAQMGIITGLTYSKGILSFRFKNERIRTALEKSGSLLETKIYLLAMQMLDENGNFYFDNAMSGVSIDWDGVIEPYLPNVNNEIDVMLTRGMVTAFISCKNGAVDQEELYKLNSVAERFGGDNERKMLIISKFKCKQTNPARVLENLVFRGEEMGITVLSRAAELDDSQLEAALRALIP